VTAAHSPDRVDPGAQIDNPVTQKLDLTALSDNPGGSLARDGGKLHDPLHVARVLHAAEDLHEDHNEKAAHDAREALREELRLSVQLVVERLLHHTELVQLVLVLEDVNQQMNMFIEGGRGVTEFRLNPGLDLSHLVDDDRHGKVKISGHLHILRHYSSGEHQDSSSYI
jgi:hypothetical protein